MLSSETVILSIENVPSNAVVDIEVQPLPIDTFFSDEQFENVLSLSFVSLFGISIFFKATQLWNAPLSMVVRFSDSSTEVSFLQL